MTKAPFIGGQDLYEYDKFIEYVNERKPRSYLEVGARRGRALDYFVRRVPSITRVVAVDWPGQQWGRKDSEIELERRLIALAPECGITYEILLGNSQTEEMAAAAAAACLPNKAEGYDLVFIDADHSYEGVLKDFELYAPLSNDMVAMHDINHPPDSNAYGPTKLWEEVKDGTASTFIREGSRKGIGVILL